MDEDTGLETGPPRAEPELPEGIDTVQARARAAVQAVAEALDTLLRSGGRPHGGEAVLPGLWLERDRALRALGLAVLDCELVDGDEGAPPAAEGSADEGSAVESCGGDRADDGPAPVDPPHPRGAGPGAELLAEDALTEELEPVSPAEPAPAPPPDPAAVELLGQHFAGERPARPVQRLPEVPAPWMVLADAQPPARPLDMAGAIGELRMLQGELRRLRSTDSSHRALAGMAAACIVARARVLQVEWCQPPVEMGLQRLFSELTRCVGDAGLAYIVGLKREHVPPAGTWRAEVKARTARLHAAVYGATAAPRAPAPRPPARAARSGQAASGSGQRDAALEVPPAVLARLKGQRGLVVGGDNRGKARARIRAALGLEALDWESGKNMRRVKATAGRLKNGRYGLVIVLQGFISHKVTRMVLPAVPSGDGVRCAFVPRGYGIDGVIRAVVESVEGEE